MCSLATTGAVKCVSIQSGSIQNPSFITNICIQQIVWYLAILLNLEIAMLCEDEYWRIALSLSTQTDDEISNTKLFYWSPLDLFFQWIMTKKKKEGKWVHTAEFSLTFEWAKSNLVVLSLQTFTQLRLIYCYIILNGYVSRSLWFRLKNIWRITG